MKSKILLPLAVIAALSLAACDNKPAEPAASTDTTTTTPDTTTPPAAPMTPAPAETPPAGDAMDSTPAQ